MYDGNPGRVPKPSRALAPAGIARLRLRVHGNREVGKQEVGGGKREVENGKLGMGSGEREAGTQKLEVKKRIYYWRDARVAEGA